MTTLSTMTEDQASNLSQSVTPGLDIPMARICNGMVSYYTGPPQQSAPSVRSPAARYLQQTMETVFVNKHEQRFFLEQCLLIGAEGLDHGVAIPRWLLGAFSKKFQDDGTNAEYKNILIPNYTTKIIKMVVELLHRGETNYTDDVEITLCLNCMKHLGIEYNPTTFSVFDLPHGIKAELEVADGVDPDGHRNPDNVGPDGSYYIVPASEVNVPDYNHFWVKGQAEEDVIRNDKSVNYVMRYELPNPNDPNTKVKVSSVRGEGVRIHKMVGIMGKIQRPESEADRKRKLNEYLDSIKQVEVIDLEEKDETPPLEADNQVKKIRVEKYVESTSPMDAARRIREVGKECKMQVHESGTKLISLPEGQIITPDNVNNEGDTHTYTFKAFIDTRAATSGEEAQDVKIENGDIDDNIDDQSISGPAENQMPSISTSLSTSVMPPVANSTVLTHTSETFGEASGPPAQMTGPQMSTDMPVSSAGNHFPNPTFEVDSVATSFSQSPTLAAENVISPSGAMAHGSTMIKPEFVTSCGHGQGPSLHGAETVAAPVQLPQGEDLNTPQLYIADRAPGTSTVRPAATITTPSCVTRAMSKLNQGSIVELATGTLRRAPVVAPSVPGRTGFTIISAKDVSKRRSQTGQQYGQQTSPRRSTQSPDSGIHGDAVDGADNVHPERTKSNVSASSEISDGFDGEWDLADSSNSGSAGTSPTRFAAVIPASQFNYISGQKVVASGPSSATNTAVVGEHVGSPREDSNPPGTLGHVQNNSVHPPENIIPVGTLKLPLPTDSIYTNNVHYLEHMRGNLSNRQHSNAFRNVINSNPTPGHGLVPDGGHQADGSAVKKTPKRRAKARDTKADGGETGGIPKRGTKRGGSGRGLRRDPAPTTSNDLGQSKTQAAAKSGGKATRKRRGGKGTGDKDKED